ncbi:hypothetical protein [Methanobacterium sp.]|uniref:hypothetical protein n=1 Tax=Methanobacterium sp. TaxID=2164 RepID=UPI003C770CE7
MVGRGKITTVISDAALIVGSVYTAGTISGDVIVSSLVLVGGVAIAVADAIWPETVDKIESALENQDALE